MIRALVCSTLAVGSLALGAAHAGADSKLPAHYAALFDKGHTWTYDVALTLFDSSPATTTKQVVTCTVVAVAEVPIRGLVSQVTCTPHVDADYVEHFYFASADGLRILVHIDKLPTTADDLDAASQDEIAIPAKPKVTRTVLKAPPAVNPQGRSVFGVRAEGKNWCRFFDSSTSDPDGSVGTECFQPGVGIVSGDLHVLNKTYKVVYKLASSKTK